MSPAVRQRVVVAISGGVDSSVAAKLLVDQGYEVIGATLQLRPCGQSFQGRSCCGPDALGAARSVCASLSIPHYVLDVASAFEDVVLRHSWQEYQAGRTPNPCVICNQAMKFGFLKTWAQGIGAEQVASGHYARRVGEPGGWQLARGLDANKDQSYFLATLPSTVLDSLLLPLGGMTKDDVKGIAREFGLASASRKESQDACFIPEGGTFPGYLRDRFGGDPVPGVVRHVDGTVLGRVPDIMGFTLGQRRGMGVRHTRPLFVVGLDIAQVALLVSDDPRDLMSLSFRALAAGRFLDSPPRGTVSCLVQTRYRQVPTAGRITCSEPGLLDVALDQPVASVTPGQLAVFYHGDGVLGSGIIDTCGRGSLPGEVNAHGR